MTQNDADNSLFSLAQIQHLMRVEFNRAQRYGYAISCLMIAVDRLGHLRDMYGYDSKEEIVDTMIRLLKTETRSSDFLGRMADDRLLAVIPHTGATGIDVMGARLLDAARQLEFLSEGRQIRVTLSLGGSHDPGGSTERTLFFDALLEGADEGLEEAVAAGGNRPDRVGYGEVHPLASIAADEGTRNADSEVLEQRRIDGSAPSDAGQE
jgi:two-component system cell cycle response regulator